MTLDAILSEPRPGRLNPKADQRWLELRHELHAAELCGPFDPRRIPLDDDFRRAEWNAARRIAAARFFKNDPRVSIP